VKTILVPTDFTQAADNAALYALDLARYFKANILLYHTYHLPISTVEAPLIPLPSPELEKYSLQRLEENKTDLLRKAGKQVDISCLTTPGFAVDEILDIADSEDIDLVVMGVASGGNMIHKVMGSVATGVLGKIEQPLIVVPEQAHFVPPVHIGFACDYNQEISTEAIHFLKEFIAVFGAELDVINIEKPEDKLSFEKAVSSVHLESELAGVNHAFHYKVDKNVLNGLMDFENHHALDMLIMIPRHHTFFERIFQSSLTKGMVFRSAIPVLALMDGKTQR
jgi:nucleotide-binding universal stress UspA family protein